MEPGVLAASRILTPLLKSAEERAFYVYQILYHDFSSLHSSPVSIDTIAPLMRVLMADCFAFGTSSGLLDTMLPEI